MLDREKRVSGKKSCVSEGPKARANLVVYGTGRTNLEAGGPGGAEAKPPVRLGPSPGLISALSTCSLGKVCSHGTCLWAAYAGLSTALSLPVSQEDT